MLKDKEQEQGQDITRHNWKIPEGWKDQKRSKPNKGKNSDQYFNHKSQQSYKSVEKG